MASHDIVRSTTIGRALVAERDVVEVHDLHVWTVTSGFPALSAHVLVEPEADCHAARRRLERTLADRFGLSHTTLQVEHAEPANATVELGEAVAQPLLNAYDDGRLPGNSINFITCHDGFTLHDLTSYNTKHNEANGEDNRDGSSNNLSFNHGVEGPTDDPARSHAQGHAGRRRRPAPSRAPPG